MPECIFAMFTIRLQMNPDIAHHRKSIPTVLYGHAAAGAAMVIVGYFLAVLVHFEWLLGSWSTPYVLMGVVAVMVMVLLTVRREEQGLAFRRAFGLAFLAGWLARMGYNLFILIFFGLLRPDLGEAYVELVLEKSLEAFAVFGLGGISELEGMSMETMLREQAVWSLSPAGQAVDALTAMFWVAIVALVVAAILRRLPATAEFKG